MNNIVDSLTLQKESFDIDNGADKVVLDGKYSIATYYNHMPFEEMKKGHEDYWNKGGNKFHCKLPYVAGNILYKEDEPDIQNMIDLIISASFEKVPPFVDSSVHSKTVMRGGTICPSKEVIFRYQGKLFILYGRYIFGYDKPFLCFKNKNPIQMETQDDESSISEHDESYNPDDYDTYDSEAEDIDIWEKDIKPKMTRDKILLPCLNKHKNQVDDEYAKWMDDYNYAFSIEDEATGTLIALATYA